MCIIGCVFASEKKKSLIFILEKLSAFVAFHYCRNLFPEIRDSFKSVCLGVNFISYRIYCNIYFILKCKACLHGILVMEYFYQIIIISNCSGRSNSSIIIVVPEHTELHFIQEWFSPMENYFIEGQNCASYTLTSPLLLPPSLPVNNILDLSEVQSKALSDKLLICLHTWFSSICIFPLFPFSWPGQCWT